MSMTSPTTRTLLCLALLVGIVAANEFEITFASHGDCDSGASTAGVKGTNGKYYVENDKYRVVNAKIFWVDSKGKIKGMSACNVPASKTCTNRGDQQGTPYLFLAVTLTKSSFEDQDVHYMYNEEDFQLSKIEDPKNAKATGIHNLNNFLYVKSATYNGKKSVAFNAGPCRENRAKSLISGHGYFIAKMNDKSDTNWHNMYYDPPNINYYIRVPK